MRVGKEASTVYRLIDALLRAQLPWCPGALLAAVATPASSNIMLVGILVLGLSLKSRSFDKATSELDPVTEDDVQTALAANAAERTILVIAHCPSTVSNADRIHVFEQGCIVESGTYADLRARGGVSRAS